MIKFKVVTTTEIVMAENDFQEWLNNVAESVGCDSDGLDSKTAIEDYLLESYDSGDLNTIYYASDTEFKWLDINDDTIKNMLEKAKEYIEEMEEEDDDEE
jgi:hypothetical protein